jgi:glycosyltransferase involved in cell wall biosynthesis
MNLSNASLTELKRKGNIGYAEALYNPGNLIEEVHHVCWTERDKGIRLHNSTIKIHVLKCLFPGLILNFFFHLWQLVRIIKRNNISMIRIRDTYMIAFLAVMAAKISRIPVVVSLGGNNRLAQDLLHTYAILNNRYLSFKIEEFVLKNANKIFCPNHYTKRYVLELGVEEDKIRVIPLMLKQDIFNASGAESDILCKNGIDEKRPIVLYIGRMERDKQVDILVEAIPLIRRQREDVEFVFVGDGSLKKVLLDRVRKLQCNDCVWFLGFLTTDLIKYCLKKSSIVWIPMAGFVVYEVAAFCRPIIAFDIEWHSEFVEHGVNGLLVENRNTRKLAEAVIDLLRDPERASRMGMMARQKVDYQVRKLSLRTDLKIMICEKGGNCVM